MKFTYASLSVLGLAGKLIATETKTGSLDSENNASDITSFLATSCEPGNDKCEGLVDFWRTYESGLYQSPRGLSSDEDEVLIEARKLKQMKVLILWLQPEHRFARYCFYGCWCLPDNDHKLFTAGYGKPVDNIDGACKRQSQCYDCAQMDHSDRVCDASTMGYRYALHFDPEDPDNHMKKSIECLDEPGNKPSSKGGCKRSICECDKKLSEDLRLHFAEWDENNHQEQGTFDPQSRCIVEGCSGGNCGGHELECCGHLYSGPRMPYRTNGRRKCCGDKTYDSTFQECCPGNTLAALGTC